MERAWGHCCCMMYSKPGFFPDLAILHLMWMIGEAGGGKGNRKVEGREEEGRGTEK